MTRRELILEMSAAIWRLEVGGVGRVPKALVEAAEDLAGLYELANNSPVLEVAHRLRRAGGGVDAGECLVQLALDTAPQSYVDAAGRADIAVPTFDLQVERAGDEIDVGWEGAPEARGWVQNPRAKRNTGDEPVVLLLEDDPALQKSTTRMIKKILPGAQVAVSDNVDGVIGNLRLLDPVLIVSDVDVIGNKSGIDLFHYVRDRYPQYVDRFVFFTGNLDAQDEHYGFVAKPADWKRLQEEILAPAPVGGRTASPPPPPPPPPRSPPRHAHPTGSARQILGFQPSDRLTAALIKSRHRTLAKQHHPDRGGSVQAMAAINDAADRLIRELEPVGARVPSTAEVAALVKGVLPSIRTGWDAEGRGFDRFGDEKVFISAIWRRLKDDPRMGGMSLDSFKRTLVLANRERLLNLARADLVAAMAYSEVEGSEIQDGLATFHFVVDRPERAPHRPAPAPDRFVEDVLRILPSIGTQTGPSGKDMGRYGQESVFIAAAWRRLTQMPAYQTMSLDEFKQRLLTANREQRINLARADLVDDMDPEEVELSEIDDGYGTFHFILDNSDRAPVPAGGSWAVQRSWEAQRSIPAGEREYMVRQPDGRQIWVRARDTEEANDFGSIVYDNIGKPVYRRRQGLS